MLQQNLNTVSDWCNINRMSLNINKCVIISFTNSKNKINFNYTLNNISLSRQQVVRDLGILFDDKLNFHSHYDYLVTKCNKLLGFISRSTKDFKKSTQTLKILYCSLVRSTIEYGSVIWSPFYNIHIDRLERVQKRFLNVVCYRTQLGRQFRPYSIRLQHFNMQRLSSRRQCSELLILYKIIHSYIDCPSLLSLLYFITRFKQRNPSRSIFQLQVYKNNTSYYNPITRMCRLYNDTVAMHSSLDIFIDNVAKFKNSIRKIFYDTQ